MARAAAETASILTEIYNEDFCSGEGEPFRLGWDQLRGIAGVERLSDELIARIGKRMLDAGYVLVPFDNFLLVGMEHDYRGTRKVPARLVESYLAVSSIDDDGDQELSDAVIDS